MITDVNVSVSRWPFRRLAGDELPVLIDKLFACGVTQAWVGSFDGLFHKDVDGANARLVDACRTTPAKRLLPFGTVNPLLPDWREDLRRCQEDYGMPGIRLHPNYHGYRLDDPVCAELLTAAAQRKLLVQLAVRAEDPRMQHPLMRVADVDTKPLPGLLAARPDLRLILLNALQVVPSDTLDSLIRAGQVFLEISTLEGVAGVSSLLTRVPIDRLLFGSHYPFFVLESALLKLRESALSPAHTAAITHENAARLMQQTTFPGVQE
ncbi:MAG: amidohydrolase family protein [Pirellulaceae bacterium]